MKIVLLGYMTSGKSSVGKKLAKRMNLTFYDLDEVIEETIGLTIPQIFAQKGELFFRKKETEILVQLLDKEEDMILALGGGTPCYGNNMDIVNQKTPYTVYLKLPMNTLIDRIIEKKSTRPLVADLPNKEIPDFVRKHVFERAPFYEKANYTVLREAQKPKAIAKEIQHLI